MVAQASDGGALLDRHLCGHRPRDEAADDRLGIISPFTRHPVQAAMDARVVQEAAGPGRFLLGFGTSKIFLNNAQMQTNKTLGPMRDAVEIVRGVLGGRAFEYSGSTWSASVPGARRRRPSRRARCRRSTSPATAPKMQALAGEIGDGCLTPSITTPPFVGYTRENVGRDIDIGCTIVASIHESDRDAGRDGAREIAGMYLGEQGAEHPGLGGHAARPGRDRAGRDQAGRRGDGAGRAARGQGGGHGRAAGRSASRSPARPTTASRRSRSTSEAGCTHVMLELWGDRRHEQIRLFGEQVLPPRALMALAIDRDRLVDWASKAISIPSFTGSEEEMARFVAQTFEELGLQVQWQQVEEGRANVLGTLAGAGGGPALMFNGHMDTSYSGREPWLAHVPGFQPEPFVREERLYGLGISNMKGALACYVEAVRALRDAGVALKGDLLVAAVCGEIEKAQYGDAQGAEYRGYATGTRHLVTHGGLADMCILGEPTEERSCSATSARSGCGSRRRATSSTRRSARASATRTRSSACGRCSTRCWSGFRLWEDDPENSYRGAKAIVNIGALQGGFGWRVSRTPHRTDLFLDVRVPPTKPMPVARREVLDAGSRARGGGSPTTASRARST